MYEVNLENHHSFFRSKDGAEKCCCGLGTITRYNFEPKNSSFFELIRYKNNRPVRSEGFFDELFQACDWAEKNIFDATLSWQKSSFEKDDLICITNRLIR